MVKVFIASTWDMMHPGHVTALHQVIHISQQSGQFDGITIGLQTGITDRPEKNQPIQTVYERYVQLKAVLWGVGSYEILPYESEADLLNILNTLPRPFIRCLGVDYKGKKFTGLVEPVIEWDYDYFINRQTPQELVHDKNYIVYLPRAHTWSSSELRKKIEDNPVKRKPYDDLA